MEMKKFITFEGGECSGKTTIIAEVCKKLEELNSYIENIKVDKDDAEIDLEVDESEEKYENYDE